MLKVNQGGGKHMTSRVQYPIAASVSTLLFSIIPRTVLPSGMPIRWDPLLTRALARELDASLRGARLRALRFDARTRDAILLFRDRTLVWRLHPDRGWPEVRAALDPEPTDLRLRARVRRVYAPDDERILVFELTREGSGGGGVELIVEVMGNRMNAVVAEGPARTVRHVLSTREGKRVTRVGQPYQEPAGTGRDGADGAIDLRSWIERIEPVPPPERARELTRSIAWVSPLNVEALLGAGLLDAGNTGSDDVDDLSAGHARWSAAVRGIDPDAPVLLRTARGPQPYPFALAGTPSTPMPSLMDAFAACAEAQALGGDTAAALAVSPALLQRLERSVTQAERRVVRLHAEFDQREDPDALRALGDLMLARYGDIAPGATSAALEDFEGGVVTVELDPTRPAHENAAAYYDRAARSERAADRLPDLIGKAERERDDLSTLLDRARNGSVEASEVLRRIPELPPAQRRGDDAPLLPYKAYRSSGGLEIRVGRGARHNDDLTFRHSAPDDIWLHARHTAGAHVILRWSGSDNPPSRDLEEAGALAALHSKARTSSSVPVDWTRRKHVRKPRRSAPGAVLPERVKTIFVRPDPMLLERLATSS